MRLLTRREGRLRFSPLEPGDRYAILSHRWLPAEDEVSYSDVQNGAISKPGYQKIDFCLEQAAKDGYKKVWIDSCCINRSDAPELSQALNSMFRWYSDAAVCYVYLSDVTYERRHTLNQSEWFERGWTLQELIAPRVVQFFSCDRRYLGDKQTLRQELAAVTRYGTLEASIAERFSWSFGRKTTVPEDMSYCLVGLLGVHLVPIYGEGAEAAQDRLFHEIEKEYGRSVMRAIWSKISLQAQIEHTAQQPSSVSFVDSDKLLESLKFDNMNMRRHAIADPFQHTCTWLLQHQSYRTWALKECHRFLWIKGKAGIGKSTLVKFVDLSQHDCPSISFYFNARGTKLEHSTTGMYRSLIYQLLQKMPSLKSIALERLQQEVQYTGRAEWSLPYLQVVFRHAILQLKEPMQCFIDALDECSNHEAQDMVYFLEDLSREAPLFICFASRHYPSISIDSPEIVLEEQDEQKRDLSSYVHVRLRADAKLKDRVIDKANGVFLWAVLVVKQLNDEIKDGALYNLDKTLESLPGELMELLRSITERQDDLLRFRLCMQWLLFGLTGFHLQALCVAVLLGLNDAGVHGTLELARLILAGQITSKEMQHWMTTWSRGLAELVRGHDHDYADSVQVIHESVREFLLQDQSCPIFRYTSSVDPEGQLHEDMKSACLRCMELVVCSAEANPIIYHDFKGIHWTFVFQRHVFHFAEQAAASVSQESFLTSTDFERYLHLDGVYHALVTCEAVKLIHTAIRIGLWSNAPGRASGQTPLSLAAIVGNLKVFEAVLESEPDLEARDKRGLTALHIVQLQIGNTEDTYALCKLLLDRGASPNAQQEDGWTALHCAVVHGTQKPYSLSTDSYLYNTARLTVNFDKTFTLQPGPGDLDHVRYQNAIKRWRPSLKSWGARGLKDLDFKLITLLLQYDIDLEARDFKGRTALMVASICGSFTSIKMLVKAGMRLDEVDLAGRTALNLACAAGHVVSAHYLLSAHADASIADAEGNTALLVACTHDGFELAYAHAEEIVIENYSSSRAYAPASLDEYDPNSLARVHQCDVQIVDALLKHGVNPNAQNVHGQTALLVVCAKPESLIVAEMLLDHGAELDKKNAQGKTALRVASDHAQLDVAAMLIRRKADLLSVDKRGIAVLTAILDDVSSSIGSNEPEADSEEATVGSVALGKPLIEASAAPTLPGGRSTVVAALEERGRDGESHILTALRERSWFGYKPSR